MKRLDTTIPGVQIITPDVYHDARTKKPGMWFEVKDTMLICTPEYMP